MLETLTVTQIQNRDFNDLYHAIMKAHYVPWVKVIFLGAEELILTYL